MAIATSSAFYPYFVSARRVSFAALSAPEPVSVVAELQAWEDVVNRVEQASAVIEQDGEFVIDAEALARALPEALSRHAVLQCVSAANLARAPAPAAGSAALATDKALSPADIIKDLLGVGADLPAIEQNVRDIAAGTTVLERRWWGVEIGFTKTAASALTDLLGKNLTSVTTLLATLALIPSLAVLGTVSLIAAALLKGSAEWTKAANTGEHGVLLTLYAWVLPFIRAAQQPFGPRLPIPAARPDAAPSLAAQLSLTPAARDTRAGLAMQLTPTALLPTPSMDPQAMKKVDVPVTPRLDPHLQAAVVLARVGGRRHPTASADANEIPVLARVSDVDAWLAMSEVRAPQVIGNASVNGDPIADKIVTGRIPLKRIEAVRAAPWVSSLKAARPIRPTLERTVSDLGIAPPFGPGVSLAAGGDGVIVGIVDFGCDFAHQNFVRADGTSRILAIWDQAAPLAPGSPRDYGRLHLKPEIDAALASANPYATLDYRPAPSSHGTHVMDIAAGNGHGTGVAGCAPAADLVFVECSTDRLPWEGTGAVGVSFGDSVQLLEAVQYIFEFAGSRPCVVNLSLGTNGGPHDGTTLVEQGFDALLRDHPNRAIVIAASNSQADGIHASVNVPASGFKDLTWMTPFSQVGHELEIWAAGASPFAVELFAPDGTSLGTVEPGDNLALGQGNQPAVFIANRLSDPNNHDNFTGIFLAPGLPAGTWRVRVHSRSAVDIVGHAWIERADDAQSSFDNPDPTHCLGSISCGRETIVVGSFDAHKPNRPISFFSSAGPTRDGRQKPEVSAGGHAVLAANAGSVSGAVRKSGTSMAAPAVTGLVALMLAAAEKQGRSLTVAARTG